MQAWEEFLKYQEKQLGTETIQKWLKPLKVVHFDACNLYLEAQDSFQVLWFEEHIRPHVLEKLFNNNNHQIKVHVALHEQQLVSGNSKKGKKGQPQSFAPLKIVSDQIDPWATIQNFIPSENNEVPYKLVCELTGYDPVKDSFGTPTMGLSLFTPTYFYGNSGSGKTHLLMALSTAFAAQGYNTLYVKAETFTEHVVSAIRSGSMQTFRKAYRHLDVLLIDDIHLFARRAATQEELFHTFNTLHTLGKQIILSATTTPHLLPAIEPRLMSRFEWGITLKLDKLPISTLPLWIQKRCAYINFPISEDIETYLITHFSHNAKTLCRALETLLFQRQLDRRSLHRLGQPFQDLQLAKQYLAKLIEEEKKNALTPQKIVRIVADFYGLRMEDILGKSQSHDCSLPRQIAMHLCRQELKMPFLKIGAFFDRDHSTVMSSVKQIQKKIEEQEKEVGTTNAEILRRIHSGI